MKVEPLKDKTLCIVIPVYNEEKTIAEILDRVINVSIEGINKQIIVVDDKSTDSTINILKEIPVKYPDIKVIFKDKNEGKGSALKAGFAAAEGDFIIVQDADLEYDPEDYKAMLDSFRRSEVDVVYGSRFLGKHRAFLFLNYVANKILNLVTNILYDTTLTDMETCYKMFKAHLIKGIDIKSKGFEIEPEITA
ncbi:MAG TPA: glycosyltransferase family 2 protein, partial [Candidatus Goldiibacteriota bacterium]|nr:glycosyltransferase family 2 protein [Candidatus Goldiibacteriota bacterium]